MEDPKDNINSLGKLVGKSGSREESGWTDYFDDYFTKNTQEHSYSSSCFNSPPVVSDAMSRTAEKTPRHAVLCSAVGGGGGSSGGMPPKIPTKLEFKKTRMEVKEDESLVDTACSPVNCPKVKGSTSASETRRRIGFHH